LTEMEVLLPGEDVPADGASKPTREDRNEDEDDEPPYSARTELCIFFCQGVPLCLAAILEWGAPPLVTMFMAGATDRSQELQSALGYGRAFFNITVLMVMLGMTAYAWNVVPGCIGANRKDRIPHYLRRGVVLSAIAMLPSLALQFFSAPIMRAFGVDHLIARQVGMYTRIMSGAALLLLVEAHIECAFVSLGFARSASFNSLCTGLGVDVAASYLLIYRWRWGVVGAALAWLSVRAARLVVWLCLALYFGLLRTLFLPATREPLLSRSELAVFARLASPAIVGNFSGWLIFELQILAVTAVSGISAAQVAACAIWVQCEQAIAASQTGWIQVCSMRSLVLLGKQDPGAGRAYAILVLLSAGLVAVVNAALVGASALGVLTFVSNDAAVRQAFGTVAWLLLPHAQTRVLAIVGSCLFIPLGRPLLMTPNDPLNDPRMAP